MMRWQTLQTPSISIVNVLTAAAIGYFAWGEHMMALGLAVAIAYLWAQAPTRTQAGLIAFAYYLMVARGMPKGAAVFFGTDATLAIGVAFWLFTAALLAAPWALFWPKGRAGYWWRLLAVLIAITVPPLGLFGWGNPLTAAGALFPRASWFGLLATFVLMLAYCYVAASRHTRYVLAAHAALALTLVYGGSQHDPVTDAKGVDTTLSGVGLGRYDYMQAYRNNQALIETASKQTAATVLLPESVAGLWQSTTIELWSDAEKLPQLLFLGAAEPHRGGEYSNVIVALTPMGQRIAYRQRVPVPVGMWHPWREDSAVAHWRGPGSFQLGGMRYGALLCYEQILLWPVLQTYAEKPALVLAPTNAWWSRDTSVPAVQKSIVRAWARLFGVPSVTAFNY